MMKIEKLYDKAKKYELNARSAFWQCPLENLEKIYNGCGPDWMPEWTRTILSSILDLFGPAFLIHDFDFELSDGTRENFSLANKRMWKNMQKILSAEYPLTNWKLWKERIYWWTKGWLAYRACVRGGWSAWLDK